MPPVWSRTEAVNTLTELNQSRLSISGEVMQRLLSVVRRSGFIDVHACRHQNC